MKILCNVSVGNRLAPNARAKHSRSTLALCKQPKSVEFSVILFSGSSKHGTKYGLKNNVLQVFTRCINEGKVTIQFKEPPHDLRIQADTIQLKGFLHLFRRALEGNVSEKELTYSSMAVTPISAKYVPVVKLMIKNRSEYPSRGFPKTLEVLIINDIQRCGLDKGILGLHRLKVLDLSQNCIERLPIELSGMQCLKELKMADNRLGQGSPKEWAWMGGNLTKTLKVLDLSHNRLRYLPHQLCKLRSLVYLNIDDNELQKLPSGIGNLKQLQVFTASQNQLSSLPGSVKLWSLESLDLSYNNFDSLNNPPSNYQKTLPVASLKEYSARKVLLFNLPYPPGSLPKTLIDYLDCAKFCVCGKACFSVYIEHTQPLLISTMTRHVVISETGVMYVPMECTFCSLQCFNVTKSRVRNPVI